MVVGGPGERTNAASRGTRTVTVDRGQAHTLEAVSAGIILLASIVFALQVTVVTPLSASTASQHIENQQAGAAGGLLDSAAENGELKSTVLYWNESSGRFHGSGEEVMYMSGGPPTAFGEQLNETFLHRGTVFNMYVKYNSGGDVREQQIVNLGEPSDNSVTVRRTVAIYDHDHIYEADETKNEGVTVSEASPFYMNDQSDDSPLFNVVQVELTIWRM